MPDPRRFELDEILIRPGTYFNPETEITVTVDDSSAVEADVFEGDPSDGGEWVLLSDELAIDEERREELLESFQARHRPGDPEDDVEEELEPDPDEDE